MSVSGGGISTELPPAVHAGPVVAPLPKPSWVEFAGLAIISFALSGVMAVFMTLFAVGLVPEYPVAALVGWGLGFVVSFPAAIVIVPPVVGWQMRQTARNASRRGLAAAKAR